MANCRRDRAVRLTKAGREDSAGREKGVLFALGKTGLWNPGLRAQRTGPWALFGCRFAASTMDSRLEMLEKSIGVQVAQHNIPEDATS
jgi:hypothetical protein